MSVELKASLDICHLIYSDGILPLILWFHPLIKQPHNPFYFMAKLKQNRKKRKKKTIPNGKLKRKNGVKSVGGKRTRKDEQQKKKYWILFKWNGTSKINVIGV